MTTSRDQLSEAKQILWNSLLGKRQLFGYKFTRDYSFENYFFDFFCLDSKFGIIIINSDSKKNLLKNSDKAYLKRLGYTVFLIRTDEIFHDFHQLDKMVTQAFVEATQFICDC